MTSTADIRSVRVTNQEGIPCCILTIVGAKVMIPGGKILLQFHFEPEVIYGVRDNNDLDEHDFANDYDASELLPCLQIGTCLYGEELAVNSNENKKVKTRSYIFDTAHSLIEPGCNDTVAMTLSLPMDCPCTLKTDLAEMNIFCKIELTVDDTRGGAKQSKKHYEILRLELPCDVVHTFVDVEDGAAADESETSPVDVFAIAAREKKKLDEGNDVKIASVRSDDDRVLTRDILGDLTMLSLRLVDSGVAIET